MAEHRVRKNDIIYIIPNDELFEMLEKHEAFIDDYGRLMNRKTHRVLKELKHYANTPLVQQKTSVSAPTPGRQEMSWGDQFKDIIREDVAEAVSEIIGYTVDRVTDKVFYEIMPNWWYGRVMPFFQQKKENRADPKAKTTVVVRKVKTNTEPATVKPTTNKQLSKEEADAEKRKVLYLWLGMLSSLKKLHDAGEIDEDSTLAQLTDPTMLKRVNGFLSENPNLLEMEKYITLQDLLGRDLFKEGQLIPIEATEIETIAESYEHKAETDITEDNKDGR